MDVEVGNRVPPPPGRSRYGGHNVEVTPPPFYNDPSMLRDKSYRPWLVPTIVVVDIIVFIFEMLVNNCPSHEDGNTFGKCIARFLHRFSFQPWKENPLLGPSASTLDKMGGLNWYKVVHGNEGWRLVSCLWLHAGLIHLLANMICLIFIGVRLEKQFGFLKTAPIFLVSGFGGSLLSTLFLQNSVSVGASGALFGILGAMLADLLTNWTIYTNRFGALVNILIIAGINLALGIVPHVDNFAHIGGFITGFLLGFILLMEPQYEYIKTRGRQGAASKYAIYQIVLLVISSICLIGGMGATLYAVFKGKNGNDNCTWCHYLSCVPTSSWTCGTK